MSVNMEKHIKSYLHINNHTVMYDVEQIAYRSKSKLYAKK